MFLINYLTCLCSGVSPEHIRSDNGPEFTAKAVRKWLNQMEVKTLFIEPSSPWENGYIESFNGKMRDELLNREIFTTLEEAKVLINQIPLVQICFSLSVPLLLENTSVALL